MTDLTRDQHRGEAARRLLDDELLAEAFATVDAAYREAWAATGEAQERERERLWLMVRLLAKVKGHLETVIESGALAAAEIDKDIRNAA